MSTANFDQAAAFIQERARPIDQALFAYYFENGPAEDVLGALQHFQNDDGGFGHGIEPDFRCAGSSPMATSVALQYAVAVDAPADHPLIGAAIAYLLQTYNHQEEYWPATYPDVNDYPHAPWWHTDAVAAPEESAWANPNAELVGYLHRYQSLVPADTLTAVTARARRNLGDGSGPLQNPFFRYILLCWQRALPWLPAELQPLVRTRIHDTFAAYPITATEHYGEVNILWLAPGPDSILARGWPGAVRPLVDQFIDQQAADGAWWPVWQWGQYEDAWETAKVEWAGKITTETLHILRTYGKL